MKIEHEFKTVRELIKLRDSVLLNPSWQRGPVWSTPKQSLLIDSILRNYDIPMIYLRECSIKSPFTYEVVDGQQRLRSIWNFYDNKFKLSNDLDDIGKQTISNKNHKEISKNLRAAFNKFKIVIAIVKNAREPEISRIFSRMQMGVRLIPSELRNAVQTGLRHAVDTTARAQSFFIESRIPKARFKHQDYLAHAFSISYHGTKRDLKAPQIMEDYIDITDPDLYAPIIADSIDILKFMSSINKLSSYKITQKWIFVDLFYLLYKYKDKLNTIDKIEFSKAYLDFDKERIKNGSNPENLLKNKNSKKDRNLYQYINAFKIGGGLKKNLEIRHKVLYNRFAKLLGV